MRLMCHHGGPLLECLSHSDLIRHCSDQNGVCSCSPWSTLSLLQLGQAHFLSQWETLQVFLLKQNAREYFCRLLWSRFWTTPWNRKPRFLLNLYRMEIDNILHKAMATISALKSAWWWMVSLHVCYLNQLLEPAAWNSMDHFYWVLFYKLEMQWKYMWSGGKRVLYDSDYLKAFLGK